MAQERIFLHAFEYGIKFDFSFHASYGNDATFGIIVISIVISIRVDNQVFAIRGRPTLASETGQRLTTPLAY